MLTAILRIYLSTYTALTGDVGHEVAHRLCENAVYAIVEPDVVSTDADPDPTTPAGELWCELLCRTDDAKAGA